LSLDAATPSSGWRKIVKKRKKKKKKGEFNKVLSSLSRPEMPALSHSMRPFFFGCCYKI
jgi:hypothetical protein